MSIEIPARYRECMKLAHLPPSKGGWTQAKAAKVLGSVVGSEAQKAQCLSDLADWTEGQLRAIKGQ